MNFMITGVSGTECSLKMIQLPSYPIQRPLSGLRWPSAGLQLVFSWSSAGLRWSCENGESR